MNQWLAMYTDPVAALGSTAVNPAGLPLALTRGVWAGGQRHGIVLWSSDIEVRAPTTLPRRPAPPPAVPPTGAAAAVR